MRGKKFQLDRQGGKFMGVCAGIGNYLGVDATFVRIAAVVLTLLGGFPWTVIAYGVAAWAARPKRKLGYDIQADIRTLREGARDDYRSSMRDIDRRLAEVETYVTSSDSRRLSREIEELR
jgi:phage shock protein C